MGDTVLTVSKLSTRIATPEGPLAAVTDVDLVVERGQTMGLVGESGSGKSMLLKSALGFAPGSATITGRVVLAGRDLGEMRPRERTLFIGKHVGIVYQNPLSSLNPVVPIGRQVGEASRLHLGLSRKVAKARSIELLDRVGIREPAKRYNDFPHQFSGGMRQRIVIAMALACEPVLLVADEATTALDVTVQREILDLLEEIQRERHMAMILVSHDLGVVASRTSDVVVMYGGRLVERASTLELFQDPRHPYTNALMGAMPRLDHSPADELVTIPGRPPRLIGRPVGCPFADRCSNVLDECRESFPANHEVPGTTHTFHCFNPVEPVGATTRRAS